MIVLRGNGGPGSQKINIPWVKENKEYRLKALFSGKALGHFTSKQLQEGDLMLELPSFGQEMIEISSY